MMCLYTLFDTLYLRCDGPSGAIRSFRNALQTDRKAKFGVFFRAGFFFSLSWIGFFTPLHYRGTAKLPPIILTGLRFRKRPGLELTTKLSTG